MRLINEFAKKALNGSDSFTITIRGDRKDESNYHFLQSNVGKAKYIYGMRSWNNNKFYSDINLKPELVAIVSNGIVYVIDEFFLQTTKLYGQEEIVLPENTVRFDEVVKSKNEYVNNVIFPDFYNALEIEDIASEYDIKNCRERAREYLFSKNPTASFESEKLGKLFNDKDVANILCGFMDLEEEAKKRLEERKSEWISEKSIREKIRSFMKNPKTAFDWEIEIAEGLRSVEAKNVTVEFELNGIRASGKMDPNVIIRILKENDNFSSYSFTVVKQGEKLLEYLGVGGRWSKNTLRCKHIVKITYGKKELYTRK